MSFGRGCGGVADTQLPEVCLRRPAARNVNRIRKQRAVMVNQPVSGRQGNRIEIGAEMNIRHSVTRLVTADARSAAVGELAVGAAAETLTPIRTR